MTNKIEDYLDELFPNPKCELLYNCDYELLMAIVLSAQSTDKRVNSVTPIIFSKYKTLEDLSKANISDLEEIIRPFGSFRKKSSYLIEIARIRNGARAKNIIKIAQKDDKVIFYFDEKTFDFGVVDELIKKYGMRIKFSPARNPYVTYKLKNVSDIIKEVKAFLKDA